MSRVTVAAALVLATVFWAEPAASVPPAIAAAQQGLLAHVDDARRLLGADVFNDLLLRLGDDATLDTLARPDDVSPDDWAERLANIERLDASLVTQVTTGSPTALGDVRGLGETLVRSHVDKTLQPLAVYVPSSYVAGHPTPLVVALHGRPQTEIELLAVPYLRNLADTTGTIVIAPWGRGLYDFHEPGASDAYDALDAALHAFSIDSHRVYLLGYSMGGFSVYSVGPQHAGRWAAIMSIAGGLPGSAAFVATTQLRQTPVYLVTGAHDANIPPELGEQTAAYLNRTGLPVSFYEEPQGTHYLRSLMNSLARAWHDMHAGVVRGVDEVPNRTRPAPPPAVGAPARPT